LIRRSSRILLNAVAALVAGFVVLSGLLVWRLGSDEPIRLGFLTSYLEDALAASDGSFTVRFDDTLLTWAGWERTFDIRATGVRALGADGRVIAAVPEISVSLSVRALLRGQVAPTAIDVFRPRLYLTRDPDGRFRFGPPRQAGGEVAPEDGASSILPRVLAALLAPPDRDRPTGYLRNVSIIDGKLLYADRRNGFTRRAEDADIVLRRTAGGIAGELILTLAQTGEVSARLRADVSYVRAADRVMLSARFQDVAAARFADLDPDLAALVRADMMVEGQLVTSIGLDGNVGDTRLVLATGPGTLVLPTLSAEPLRVRHLTMEGRLEVGGNHLTVDEAVLELDGGTAGRPRLTLTGAVTREAARGPSGHRIRGPHLRVVSRVTAGDIPTAMVRRYWPEGVARGARNWVTRNIEDGGVEHAEADIALRIPGTIGHRGDPEIERFSGTFSAVGLTVHYLKPMPPLRDVAGIASFTDREFVADLHGGSVEGLLIDGGQVRIGDFRERGPETVEITGRAHGTLPDTLRLLDHPRLGYPSRLGLTPADTAGDVSARLSFRFPAVRDLSIDQVEIGVSAEAVGATMRGVVFDRDVTQGSLTAEVTGEEMTVAGSAVVAGIPASVHWFESFSGADGVRSRIALSGTVDAERRASFGLDTLPYLDGPVPMRLELTRFDGGRGRIGASLDLGSAEIDLPFIAWSKPAGEPGTAELVVELEGERAAAIPSIAVTAGTLSARGRGRFDGAGGLLGSVVLDSVAFGDSALENVVLELAEGRLDVSIGDGRLDAEPFLARDEGDAGAIERDGRIFTLRASRLREIRLGPDRAITDVSATVEHDGAHWDRIRVVGTLPGGRPVSLRYEPAEPDTHQLTVTAGDAGAALRVFGVLDNVRGGRLRLVAVADDAEPQRPLRGEAEISQFRLVNAPTLARLLTVATLTGLVDALTGEGFLFTRFTAEFTKTGGLVKIPLARAHGPSIGITATGEIDFDAGTLDLEGTIVPAYAINNILSNIPVVGDILQGGKGEGIFAATYDASGPLADPRITVNPLAALAPGFLRGLFDIFDGGSGERVAPRALPEPGGNK